MTPQFQYLDDFLRANEGGGGIRLAYHGNRYHIVAHLAGLSSREGIVLAVGPTFADAVNNLVAQLPVRVAS